MGYTNAWKRLSPVQLNIAIQAFSLIAIFFEGVSQQNRHGAISRVTLLTL